MSDDLRLTPDERVKLVKTLKALEEINSRRLYNRMDFFEPYEKQQEFFDMGTTKRERLFSAGNQLGKTEAGAFEFSCHVTGRYPDWWLGRRWDRPIKAWATGETGLLTRDVVQKKLFGEPGVMEARGTGYIPKSCVDWDKDIIMARGVGELYDTVQVKNINGGKSTIKLKSFEQGRQKWQGDSVDLIWMDEEAEEDIYLEAVTRTNATMGCMFTTFTPLKGIQGIVKRFYNEANDQRGKVVMTIDDVKHLSEEQKKIIIASYPLHMREARTRGVPMLGEGVIYPVPESDISVTPFTIPAHWYKLWGIDFGGQTETSHPFAAALLAWDKDTDTIYVVHTVKLHAKRPLDHAAAMKAVAPFVPVAWPWDGAPNEKGTGEPVAAAYKKEGLKMRPTPARWPDGSLSTEAGILDIYQRMTTNRFKVFSHLRDFWDEFRSYHREKGLIVKIDDDVLSAVRIGVMDLRHAKQVGSDSRTGSGRKKTQIADGVDENAFGM